MNIQDFALIDFVINIRTSLLGAIVALLGATVITRLKSISNRFARGKFVSSPDGKAVASEAEGEVYIADSAGVRNVTHHPAVDEGVVWSPDSRYIAFHSNRGGFWNVFVIEAETGKMGIMTNIGGLQKRKIHWDSEGNLHIDLGGSELAIKANEIERHLT